MTYAKPLLAPLAADAAEASCCTPFLTLTVAGRSLFNSGCYVPPVDVPPPTLPSTDELPVTGLPENLCC